MTGMAEGYNSGSDLYDEVVALRARVASLEEAQSQHQGVEETYQRFIERIGDYAIFMLDEGGRIISWNEGARRIKGYSADEIIGEHFSRFYTPEDVDKNRPAIALQTAVAHGKYEEEGWRIRKDGTRFRASVLITAIRDEPGRLLGFSKVTRDITERQKAEEALRESVERFRGAFDYAAIGMALVSLEGRWMQVNHSLCHIVGYSAEELLQKSFQEITHPDDLESDLHHLGRLLSGEVDSYSLEKRYIHKEGRFVWAFLSVSLVRGSAGEPLYFVSQIQDVTDRKAAESEIRELNAQLEERVKERTEQLSTANEELEREMLEHERTADERAQLLVREQAARAKAEDAEQRLAFLAQASSDLAASLDYEATLATVTRLAVSKLADYCIVDTIENGEICRVAIAHADPEKEETARKLLEYPPDLAGAEAIAQKVSSGESQIINGVGDEMLSRTPRDDKYLSIMRELNPKSFMVVPLIARGRVFGSLLFACAKPGFSYGPTELSLAENLATRAALAIDNARLYEDAQEAVRSREELLSIVSHDLRNQLVAVQGTAKMLARRATQSDALDPAKLVEGYGRIEAASTKMAILINEMLDFARIRSSERLDLYRRPTDLVLLARQVAAEMQQTTNKHEIEVKAALPELVGEWDTFRLERVLTNIVSNAVKYTPKGGEISIEIEQEGAEDTEGESSWAVLTVRDHGVGIPASDLPHIFERFRRAGNVAGKINGTGIGLAIAHEIVEQHGGTLEADSREGRGSTFVVRLPLQAAQPQDGGAF